MSADLSGIERAVLGTLIAEPQRVEELVPMIGTDLFTDAGRMAVAGAIIQNHADGKPVDADSIWLSLQGKKSCPVDRVGLDEFIDAASEFSFMHHVATLQDARDQRRKMEIVRSIGDAVERGLDTAELIQELQQVGTDGGSKKSSKFSFVHISDMEMREPDFLVDEIMERDSLCSLFGDPEAGKSFVAISLACSVAAGIPWYGRSTKAMPVFYIAGEGHSGLKRRVEAWKIGHGVDCDFPLFFSMIPARIPDAVHVQEVIQAVDRIAEQYGQPGLIVVDTLARNFGGLDENATSDMNAFVSGCDALRSQHGAAVLVNHHSGHSDKNRGRGSTAFRAALDREYVIRRDAETVSIACTKLKDGQRPPDMFFKFVDCIVAHGATGNPITSAYIEQVDPVSVEASKMGPIQRQAVSTLQAMYAEREANLSDRGFPPDSASVDVQEFKAALAEAGIDRRRFSELIGNEKLFKVQSGKVRHV